MTSKNEHAIDALNDFEIIEKPDVTKQRFAENTQSF